MEAAISAALKTGGVPAVLIMVLIVIGKLIDRHKPTTDRRAAELANQDTELDSLRGQVNYWRQETEKCQSDITELRRELRRLSVERHHFYNAITRCAVEHPSTSQWWTDELARIDQRIGEGQ
ncbi:MAG: hypothetical protein RJP96_02720 [Algiphilus sp.]|uniref:hypothetical protein n=1 Tax=Algiphilus sp. TaxID=1872431 RepID=UPI0032EBAC60